MVNFFNFQTTDIGLPHDASRAILQIEETRVSLIHAMSIRLCMDAGQSRREGEARASLFAAEAGEGGLILSVDGSSVLTATTSSASLRAITASRASVTTTATIASSATASATAASSTSSALRLNEARVEVNGLLGLALTLALGLAAGSSDEVLLLLLEGLGVGPLLVELAALVGLADGDVGVEGELLLGLLGEVVGVGDVLLLGLGRLLGSGLLGGGLLLLSLGDNLSGLLVLKLSSTFGGTPRLSSLLLGAAVYIKLARCCLTRILGRDERGDTSLMGVSVIALAGESTATACNS